MTTCPAGCGTDSPDGLLCHACTSRLERALGDVPAIVADLDVALSKQARIGSAGPSGLARERSPINWSSSDPRWVISNVLGTWARDVSCETWLPQVVMVRVRRDPDAATEGPMCPTCRHRSCMDIRQEERRPAPPVAAQAAALLLSEIPAIRRHPAVAELVDEVLDAISQARRIVDRPADRQYLGQCMTEFEGVVCYEEIFARVGASETTCKVCGITHEVGERRAWLLRQAEDRLFTVREAAQMMGSIGGQEITEQRIRRYIGKRIPLHRIPGNRGSTELVDGVRLGDLLEVVLDDNVRRRTA